MIITTKSQSAKIGSKISFNLKMNHVPPFITIGICFDNFSSLMDYMYYILVFVRLVYVVGLFRIIYNNFIFSGRGKGGGYIFYRAFFFGDYII